MASLLFLSSPLLWHCRALGQVEEVGEVEELEEVEKRGGERGVVVLLWTLAHRTLMGTVDM